MASGATEVLRAPGGYAVTRKVSAAKLAERRDVLATHTLAEAARILGMSVLSLSSYSYLHHLSFVHVRRQKISPELLQRLKFLLPYHTIKEAAEELGMNHVQVRHYALRYHIPYRRVRTFVKRHSSRNSPEGIACTLSHQMEVAGRTMLEMADKIEHGYVPLASEICFLQQWGFPKRVGHDDWEHMRRVDGLLYWAVAKKLREFAMGLMKESNDPDNPLYDPEWIRKHLQSQPKLKAMGNR